VGLLLPRRRRRHPPRQPLRESSTATRSLLASRMGAS
jgi:hypothetical protein